MGECGSCTVVMDKSAVPSCLVLAVDADGSEIVTTEGMSCDSEFQPHAGGVRRPLGHPGPTGCIDAERAPGVPDLLPSLRRPLRGEGDGSRRRHRRHGARPGERPVQRAVRLQERPPGSIPEIHSHPDRLLYPLKRVGARGEGKWERISWEEALDTVAEKFRTIKEESGPEYVVFGLGEPHGLEFAFAQRFALGLRHPQRHHAGLVLRGALPDGQRLHLRPRGGARRGGDPPSCSWSGGPTPTTLRGACARQTVIKIVESGAKIVVIDPRKIDLAGVADLWIKPRPGTDGALAMGLLKVVVEEELYDKDFVRDWTIGFDELKAELATFSLADVATATWVPEEQILKLARMIGEYHPTCLQWGNGIDQGVHPFQTHRAISILAAISGNLNVPGGIVLPGLGVQLRPPGQVLHAEQAAPGRGQDHRQRVSDDPQVDVGAVLEPGARRSSTEKPYRPRAAFFMLTNPMTSFVNSQETREALMKIEFTVVLDLFMTPTAALADIVLPVGVRHGARRGRLLAGLVQRSAGPSQGGRPARAKPGPTPRSSTNWPNGSG